MIKSIVWFACGGLFTACFSNAVRSFPVFKRKYFDNLTKPQKAPRLNFVEKVFAASFVSKKDVSVVFSSN